MTICNCLHSKWRPNSHLPKFNSGLERSEIAPKTQSCVRNQGLSIAIFGDLDAEARVEPGIKTE